MACMEPAAEESLAAMRARSKFGIAIAAKVENEVTDRIRGVVAVGQEVVESFEARDSLILAEGAEQVREFVFWNVEFAHGFGEGNKYRMSSNAFVAGVEFEFPLIQKFEGSGAVADLVTQVVGDAAVGVDVEEVLAQASG